MGGKALEYPDFFRVAKHLISGNTELAADSGDTTVEFGKSVITPASLDESNVVTSEVKKWPFEDSVYHKVAIDLDMDAALIPSSTKGHWHLIIDKKLSWHDYSFLLYALERVGIIQQGYLKASLIRGATVLRTPWTKKGEKKAEEPVPF